jgi:hypothetical protein
MKTNKIIYWIATGLLSIMMIMSAGMYFMKHGDVSEVFSGLGFPTYIIYPLAIAKLLAIAAIITKKSSTLKEWAYAGLFFDFLLALSGHLMIKDGEFAGALIAIILLLVSYFFDKKVFGKS